MREFSPLGHDRPIAVGLSVFIYCLSVSVVPIYNKNLFSLIKGEDAPAFPFPIATAALQLGAVSLGCAAYHVAAHVARRCGGAPPRDSDRNWLFGPHFGYKLRHIAPVGLLFGVKYGVTNWGLALLPTNAHVLLQSTDLIWTVMLARCVNGERAATSSPPLLAAVVLSTAGALLIAHDAAVALRAPLVPLLVNGLTPVFLALCVVYLRRGAQELWRADGPLRGGMSALEFTALKLALSSGIALALACLLEGGGGGGGAASWWATWRAYGALGKAKVVSSPTTTDPAPWPIPSTSGDPSGECAAISRARALSLSVNSMGERFTSPVRSFSLSAHSRSPAAAFGVRTRPCAPPRSSAARRSSRSSRSTSRGSPR